MGAAHQQGMTPTPARPDQLHMTSVRHDMGVSFTRPPGRVDHLSVMLTPDRPLDWGFEEASAHVAPEHVDRLSHWLLTGTALPRDERVPHPAEALLDPDVVVPVLAKVADDHLYLGWDTGPAGRTMIGTGVCRCGERIRKSASLAQVTLAVQDLHGQHVAQAQVAALLAALTSPTEAADGTDG